MARARILLADADEAVRVGVRGVLEAGDLDVCAQVATADDAVAAAQREQPDLCLIDVDLPGGGIAAAARIAREVAGVAIVMLSNREDEHEVIDAVRAGASGYLPKDMDPTRLPFAVRGVLAGEAAVPRRLTAKVIHALRGRGGRAVRVDGRPVTLSQREYDVLALLGEDLDGRDIADRLGISPITVRRHVSGLMEKLGAPDRDALRRLAGGDM